VTRIHPDTQHGKIDLDSVVETPDGIEYKTAYGSRRHVVMEKEGDRYKVHAVEPAK
jgi:hypothetical protein